MDLLRLGGPFAMISILPMRTMKIPLLPFSIGYRVLLLYRKQIMLGRGDVGDDERL